MFLLYLNTSHVNVKYVIILFIPFNTLDLNTSHVNVKYISASNTAYYEDNLNTSHVNVKFGIVSKGFVADILFKYISC